MISAGSVEYALFRLSVGGINISWNLYGADCQMNGYHKIGFFFTSIVFLVLVILGIDHRFLHERLYRFITGGNVSDIVFSAAYALSFVCAPVFLFMGYLKDRRKKTGIRTIPFLVHVVAIAAGNFVMFFSFKAPSAKILIIPAGFAILYSAGIALIGWIRSRRAASRY